MYREVNHKWSISGQIIVFVKMHKEKEVYYPQIIYIKLKSANCNGLFFLLPKITTLIDKTFSYMV